MIRTHYNDPPVYAEWEPNVRHDEKSSELGVITWKTEDENRFRSMTEGRLIDGILCYLHPITRCWHSVATGGRVE